MKANILLNVEVISKKNRRRLGLIKSLVVVNHIVVSLVISQGGLLSKAQLIEPSKILDVDYKQLVIKDESEILRIKAKEVKTLLENAFPLMDIPVVDINGDVFGKIVNADIDPDTFEITTYEVSRSFFDDINFGYGIIHPSELVYENKVLMYQKEMFELSFDNENAGIAKKLLGVK